MWGMTLSLIAAAAPQSDSAFGRLVAELSEPGGFFWSDNLVSNETSYLHVVGKLSELGVRGGAYIGVGPEQNFSYIAAVDPAIAYIVDIRRDNMLLHLVFKAAFEQARNRLEYLSLVYGRPVPADVERWTEAPLADILDRIDAAPVDSVAVAQSLRLLGHARSLGVPLDEGDVASMHRLHGEFVAAGLSLRFSSYGSRSWTVFPTARQLYLSTDLRGESVSYLASEGRFGVVQRLQREGRVVPVVGNLAGPRALVAVGRHARGLGAPVTLMYTSNVEFYLFRDGSFRRFVDNVATLPRGERGFLARSYFDRQTGLPHPLAIPGHFSVQVLEPLSHFVTRGLADSTRTYWDVVVEGAIPLQPEPRGGLLRSRSQGR